MKCPEGIVARVLITDEPRVDPRGTLDQLAGQLRIEARLRRAVAAPTEFLKS